MKRIKKLFLLAVVVAFSAAAFGCSLQNPEVSKNSGKDASSSQQVNNSENENPHSTPPQDSNIKHENTAQNSSKGTHDMTNTNSNKPHSKDENNSKTEKPQTPSSVSSSNSSEDVKPNEKPDVKPDNKQPVLLPAESLSVVKGSSTILPELCKNVKIQYSTDIPLIATVDSSGKVKGERMGNACVTALAKKDNITYIKKYKIHVFYKDSKDLPNASSAQFAQVRSTWKESLVGQNNDMSNKSVQKIVLSQNKKAKSIWQTMKKDGTYLWEELPKKKKGSEYTTDPMASRGMYQNLEAMSRAYALSGGELYKNPKLLNDIKYGLEWLYTNAYHPGMQEYGNWWQWEIGMPKQLNNICTLLYDDLGSKLVRKYTDAIYYFQPDPFLSGACGKTSHVEGCRLSRAANRADVSITAMLLGALREDSEQLAMSKDAAEALLQDYVQPNKDGTLPDGFYKDGSFIQHGHIPYVGTYGEVFLTGVLNVAQNLAGTPWELPQQKMSILGEFAVNSFAPFMTKVAVMYMTRGRAVSRDKLSDRDSGHALIGDFIRLAESLPASDSKTADNLRSMAKTWISEDTLAPYLETCSDLQLLGMAKKLCENNKIPVQITGPMHHNFAIQDRMVHRGKNYAIGLSMFSNRINNFEYMNGENKHGWHTSDGMYYLYNNDLEQYSCDYWNTVNPYKLPGTTVDIVSLERKKLQPNGYNCDELCSDETWVGGTSLNNFGCNGMALSGKLHTNQLFNPDGTPKNPVTAPTGFESLRAKKSYFAFDDEFVVLAAGINSSDNHKIITTVENRKLNKESQELLINGNLFSNASNAESSIADAKWAFLKGDSAENNIGYYFPGKQTIYAEKENREGSFRDINQNGSAQKVSKTYAELWFDHGKNPTDASCAYAVLPGKTIKEMQKYAANPDFKILSNTKDLQMVEEMKNNVIAANIWEDKECKVGNVSISQKAAVMVSKKSGICTVSLSDPTMQSKQIEFTISGVKEPISKNSAVLSVKHEADGKLKVTVNTQKTFGSSIILEFPVL